MTAFNGTVIRELRRKYGLSAKQVYNTIGVSNTTLWRWETGRLRDISSTNLLQLAELLQCDVKELMTKSREPVKPIMPA